MIYYLTTFIGIFKKAFEKKELSEREQVYKRLKKQAKKELKRIWKMK